MGLINDIGAGDIALDTSVFIYFIEEMPAYLPSILPLFQQADEGRRRLVTSALTLLEVLVVPYRAGDAELASQYEALLTRSRAVHMVPIHTRHLRLAARLRAANGLRTPDALQLATALDAGCATFVTNDRRLPSLASLRVVQLADYAA